MAVSSSANVPFIARKPSHRLVEIYVRRDRSDDRGSLGSGYLLGNGLVLTARHVLMPKSWGNSTPTDLVIEARALAEGVDPPLRIAELVWPQAASALSDHEAPDVALIRLPSIPARAAEPVQIAFINDDDPVVDVYAGGFPAHRNNMAGPGLRESKQIFGRVPPLSGLRSGTFEITAIRMDGDRDLDLNLNWEGISGSALLDRGRIVGVVITRAEGQGYDFRAVRLEHVLRDDLTFGRALAVGADFAGSDTYSYLCDLLDELSEARPETVAWWLLHVSGLLGDETLAQQGRSLRDLALALADYPIDPNGSSFPLFTVFEGIARDLLNGSALRNVLSILDALASRKGVTSAGILRLRRHVDAARTQRVAKDSESGGTIASDRSVLVVIEPDREIKTPPHYFVRVYDWLPWESTAMEQSTGSRGRALDGSEVGPSRTAAELLSAEGKTEIGKEIGRRLRAIPGASRFVEFVVPGALICADFDAINIDALGNIDVFGEETEPMEIPLGMWARVVVRSLERWRLVEAKRKHEPRVREEGGALLEQWKQRWCSMTNALAGPSTTCWWWKSGLDHVGALALLALPEHRNVACVGLGFPPMNRELALLVYKVLLTVGAPVALWTRDVVEGDSEALLRNIVDAADPPDLRDRVHAHRARSGDQMAGSQVGKALTLFWDDPERPPLPFEGSF